MRVILGSSSKWRQQILRSIVPEFECMDPDIDEKAIRHPDPSILCLSLARAKSDALLARQLSSTTASTMPPQSPVTKRLQGGQDSPEASGTGSQEPALLITSDQVVAWKGQVREKPASKEECRQYLRSYNEQEPAETVTAVVVVNTGTGKQVEGVDTARQYFRPLPESVIEKLIEEGEVMSCCGGFRIDHPLMAPYLLRREGEEESIMGLPKTLTIRLMEEATG